MKSESVTLNWRERDCRGPRGWSCDRRTDSALFNIAIHLGAISSAALVANVDRANSKCLIRSGIDSNSGQLKSHLSTAFYRDLLSANSNIDSSWTPPYHSCSARRSLCPALVKYAARSVLSTAGRSKHADVEGVESSTAVYGNQGLTNNLRMTANRNRKHRYTGLSPSLSLSGFLDRFNCVDDF